MNENKDTLLGIDTNILIYAFDKTNPRKHTIAKSIVEKCWKRERTLVLSSQNLAEFFLVVTTKIPCPLLVQEAEQIVNDINEFTQWNVLNYNGKTVGKAIGIHKKIKKRFWDVLLAATMMENGVFHILTENSSDFKGIEGIQAINPFL